MARYRIVKKFRSNGEEVIIRYPKISDGDDLLRNINSLVEERAFIALEKKQTKAGEKKWLATLLKNVRGKKIVALVAEINGKVVGLSQVEKNSKDAFSHVGGFGISLIKEARGRHIGERLAKAVIAEAKRVLKVRIVTLGAYACNRPAVDCYRKCGFVKTEIMKGGIKYHGKFLYRIRMVKYL